MRTVDDQAGEAVALLACGVSPYRLLRPVGVMGIVAGAATLYVMLVSIPDANQTFRELTFEVISKRIESDLSYPGQIRVTVMRETRAVEYAR